MKALTTSWFVRVALQTGVAAIVTIAGCSNERPTEQTRSTPQRLIVDLKSVPGPFDIGGGDIGSGPVVRLPEDLHGTLRQRTAGEREEDDARKPKDTIRDAPTSEYSWRDALLQESAGEAPENPIRILLNLPDRDFPWHEFRDKALTDENRVELAQARESQLSPDLDALEGKLVALGAKNVKRFWLVPAISAELPAGQLRTLTSWEEVESAGRDDKNTGQWLAQYTPGVEGRNGTRAAAFIPPGYDGYFGHRYTSDYVRVGLYEGPIFAPQHYGFAYYQTGPTRVWSMQNCDYGVCTPFTPPTGPGPDFHAMGVAGILAGNIEGGQDPSVLLGPDQTARSGFGRRARIYYYAAVNDPWSGATAIAMMQRTTTDGIDVMNHSYGWSPPGCGVCDRNCDKTNAGSSFNIALRNSTNAGTLHVFAGGNANTDNVTCTAIYPGLRRDGITVGGLETSNNAVGYDSTTMWASSSRGGMDLTINGTTWAGVASLIDLVAPACYDDLYSFNSSTSNYAYGGCGTSFASPTVAGNAVMLLNSFYSLYWPGMDARMTQTYLLMMGSGWGYDYGGIRPAGMDKRSGAGRLHDHFMGSASLTNPWGWACHGDTISSGQERIYPVWATNYPLWSSITTWKAALTWQEDNYSNAADLDLSVMNTCPAGGGSPVWVTGDSSRDPRTRVLLNSVGGKCLAYHVSGYYIPPGQTRTFTVCDYFQSGSAADN